MKEKMFIRVWLGLILLTIISAWLSTENFNNVQLLIIVLSLLKFTGVSFYFMNLQKAHIFWKSAILLFQLLFLLIIVIL